MNSTAFSGPLLGAGTLSPLVQDLGVCIVASMLFGVIFQRLRIPTIAALLGAGVLVGPIGLSLVHSQANIDTIASLGLTLLLFVIGLEVNPSTLLASGRALLVTGAFQVPLTIALGTGAFMAMQALGWSAVAGSYVPLYLGAACAFSSTLLVVKLLQETRKMDSVSGRFCIGLLIFQDIWAIIFLALQPSFEQPEITPILLTFLGIFIVVGVAVVVARWVLPVAFRIVAKMPDLVVTVALGWCFVLGLFGVHLGRVTAATGVSIELSVSMEMCALIAGASLAATPYAHEVVGKVSILRDFFVTLFFVGLGMSVPVPEGIDVLVLAFVLSVVAIALRYALFFPLLYLNGLNRRHALETSTKLAQVSEFCLVILYLGAKVGHVETSLVSVVIFAFVMTALVTPALFSVADHVYDMVRPLLDVLGFRRPAPDGQERDDGAHPRIVILGFHRVAAALLHDLQKHHAELVPSVEVLDINVATHDEIRRTGARVMYGDVTNATALEHAGVGTAELVISTVPDELLKKTSNAQLAKVVRAMNPDAVIITHATRVADIATQLAAGATDVVLSSVEAAGAIRRAVEALHGGELEGWARGRGDAHGELRARVHALD